MSKKNLSFNMSAAKKYLSVLDPEVDQFSFYAFHPKNKNNPPVVFNHCTFKDVSKKLTVLNSDGYGIYVCVNQISSDKTRTKKNISVIRSIWQEDDDGFGDSLPFKPGIIVRTSKHKFHRYILTKHKPVQNGLAESFDNVMKSMVSNFGSDKNARDISRVLRIPGFYNTKPGIKNKDKWWLVKLDRAKNKRYGWKKVSKVLKTKTIKDDVDYKPNNTWSKSRIDGMVNIRDANSYYEEMLSYSMSLANRGSSKDEICVILEALLRQGLEARPNQDKEIWRERFDEIETFAKSAVRKVKESGIVGRHIPVDGEVFSEAMVTGWNMMTEDIGEMEYLLTPKYLQSPSITLIHAVRGLGKTFFNLSMAMALATGSNFLKWTMNNRGGIRSLYIDGEMPKKAIQNQMRIISKSFVDYENVGFEESGKVSSAVFQKRMNKNFRLINIDKMPDKIMPDLTDPDTQKAVDNTINKFKPQIIFFDNITTLFKTAEEDQNSWGPVQDWMAALRARGITVVLVHHDNKEGKSQRGFSNKEDIIDYGVHLQMPIGYKSEMGSRFNVVFTKTRDLHGNGVRTFEARLEGAEVDSDGEFVIDGKGMNGSVWEWSEESITTRELVTSMIKDGHNRNDIAKETGFGKATIATHIRRALRDGQLADSEVQAITKRRTRSKSDSKFNKE